MFLNKFILQKNYRNFLILLLTFSIILLIPAVLVEAETDSEEELNQNIVYINSTHLKYEEEKTILSGDIIIRKKEITIKAAEGELIREEQKMILEEKIKADYPGAFVSSELLTAFLNEEEYIFEKEVELDYEISEEKNMILNSDYLKIFGENNSFTAEKNVEIDYDDQLFKGDKADYDGESELMYLTGNVKIEEGEDWIKSDQAEFNLKDGEGGYTAAGNVEIKMILED